MSTAGDERGNEQPEEICLLFQHYMADGDIDSVLTIWTRFSSIE